MHNPFVNVVSQDMDVPDILTDFAVIHVETMPWGDMDAFQHLNNVAYYRYAESARISYLHKLDIFTEDKVIILAHSSCNYLRPVFFPDTLLIGVRCKKLGNTSLVFEYVFFSQQQQQVVATAEAVIVQMDKKAENKLVWSPEQKQHIFALESAVGHVPAN